MALTKVYNRINWENEPSLKSPLNETNLNTIDYGLNEVDNRVISLDTTKLNKSDSYNYIKNVSYDDTTGEFTFTRVNDTTFKINTKLEKLAVNFSFDKTNQQLIFELDDGTEEKVSLSSLISEYDFADTQRIKISVLSGQVTADLIKGTITDDYMQPNYLADINQASTNALNYAKLAKSWAQGGTNVRDDESTNNSKYWAQIAESFAGVASGNAINYRGDYNSNVEYSILDAVYYNSSTWVAKVNNPLVAPSEGGSWRYLAKGIDQPMVFLTLSEYDNLPVGKVSDDKLYFIE